MAKMNLRNTTTKKAMLKALEKSLGVVTTACNMVGIDRSTHYEWIKKDEDYKASVEEMDNITLDFAESQLHRQIKDGNTSATIFYLKTKGKKRGYIERQEITGKDGEAINPRGSMTFADRKKRIKELEAKLNKKTVKKTTKKKSAKKK